jgi:hypothetical protein
MNQWLGIALVAYLMGAVIEGVATASQLFGLASELSKESHTLPSSKWQVFITIGSVSICAALCWPCRLVHRSIKGWISLRNL